MSSSSQAPESWISAFCSLVGHEYFAEVSEDFIEDDFNLTGLQSQVPMYKEALEMILDVEPEDASDEEQEEDDDEDDDFGDGSLMDEQQRAYRREERRHLRMASDLSVIESSAEMLYGLIHQRFITSRAGIQQMLEKYELGHFGHCPRVFCDGAKVLPVGCSDIPGQETVKLFCPSCLDVYAPPNSRFQTVDGAFFGTTFGCLFFMTFPELDVRGVQTRPVSDGARDAPSLAAHTTSASKSSLSSGLSSQQHPAAPPAPPSAGMTAAPQPESINGTASRNLAPGLGRGNIYEPRIYGFRVSEFAKTGPRMKWLRQRPSDINELDECKIWAEQQALIDNDTVKGQAVEQSTGIVDSEMAEGNIEDAGEEEEDEDEEETAKAGDADMDVTSTNYGEPMQASQTAQDTSRRKGKQIRRDQSLSGMGVNGDRGGGAAVRVGEGG